MTAPATSAFHPSRQDALHVLVPLRRPRVLVVDDDRDLVPVFRRVLHQLDPDVPVDWAVSVQAAVERLSDEEYDLVVADFLLEDEPGSAVQRWLKARDPDANFTMISAVPIRWELDSRAVERVPFLPKPFSPSDLRAFLAEVLPAP